MSGRTDFSAFYNAKPEDASVSSIYGMHWRGKDIVAVFRDSGVFNPNGIERPQEIEFKDVAKRHDLASAIGRGYFLVTEQRSPATRNTNHSYLKPFFAFLDEIDPDCMVKSLAQIDTALINRYIAWISQRTVGGRHEAERPMSKGYKEDIYCQLRFVIEALRRDGRNDLAADCMFRRNPWAVHKGSGASRTKGRSRILNDAHLRAIHAACEMEVRTTIAEFDRVRGLIDTMKGIGDPDGSGLDISTPEGLYAFIERRHKGILPHMEDLQISDPGLHSAIRAHGGKERVVSGLVATPTTLMPFIILLAMRTFFNPDALVGIKDSFCREAHWLWGGTNWEILSGDLSEEGENDLARLVAGGVPEATALRTVLSTYKGRKQDMVTRTFRASDRWDSPPKIIETVRYMTARLRPAVPEVWQDRLFLFQNPNGAPTPRSYMDENGASSDSGLGSALKRFTKRHLLEEFTLSSFRLTGADVVWEATDGNAVAVAAVLGNEVRTASEHYDTPGNVLRNEHRMSVMTNRRVRLVKTKGRSRLDHTACTPGFHCIDPYNSPRPDQIEGELCTSYPSCPICPLAALDASRPDRVAWVINLSEGIEAAKADIDPARWHGYYKRVLGAIESKWLSRVSPDIMREARTLSAGLPNLPELE